MTKFGSEEVRSAAIHEASNDFPRVKEMLEAFADLLERDERLRELLNKFESRNAKDCIGEVFTNPIPLPPASKQGDNS